MERGRVLAAVSEAWGHGTIFTFDPESTTAVDVPATAAPPKAMSGVPLPTISEKVEEIKIPEPVALVPVYGLPYLSAYLFATILEDVMAQLWTLERCNNALSIDKTLSDVDYFKAIKYGVLDPNEVKDELEGLDIRNLNCVIYKIKKLDADRKYMNNVMVSTYLGLAQYFSFHPLVQFVKEIEDRDLYRFNLQEEENQNKGIRKELSKQVRQQHIHIRSVLYDTDVFIDKLKTDVEDSLLHSEVRSRYIDNWQLARTEQHTQTIFDIEIDPASQIEYYKKRSDHELRVHSEVELLVNIAINETLSKIEEWMEKYDTDVEAMDLKIQIKKNDYQNMRDKRVDHEETLALHEVQMKDWIFFKEEREKARIYWEKMTKSAIIVQAWWRGLLVRLQLGPYKVKKKKKPKK